MDSVVTALAEQQAELTSLLAGRADAEWMLASRCAGWSVADVVLHLAQTNEMAVASATDRLAGYLADALGGLPPAASVDDGAAAMVAHERGASADEVFERWQSGASQLCDALLARQPSDRVTWVAGELSARTLATTRLAETWIHTADVSYGFAVELVPTDRLWHIARLAWRTIPYAFARAGRDVPGPVAFMLTGPHGEHWEFTPTDAARTVIRGSALDLCEVAGQRASAVDTQLSGEGPDAAGVLELIRTFA